MGMIIRFPRRRRHALASIGGRGTSSGQGTSAGQRSENQPITSSYFRAVKVFASSSKRSKKRQSPAASLPTVVTLTPRALAYEDAQAMRFERSSDSIVADNKSEFSDLQALSVGKFRLAESSDVSDKSAMSSVQEVRQRIQQAFDRSGESPITVALEWDFERNHIRDFLEGKKDSLKPEVLDNLSERYGIPLNLLIIKRQRKKRKVA